MKKNILTFIHNLRTPEKLFFTFSILAFIAITGIVPVMLGNNLSQVIETKALGLSAGDLANRDIIAENSFFYIDESATLEAQRLAMDSILPVFTISLPQTLSVLKDFESLKTILLEMNTNSAEKLQLAKKASLDSYLNLNSLELFLTHPYSDIVTALNFTEEYIKKLLNGGVFSYRDIEKLQADNQNSVSLYILPDSENSMGENIESVSLANVVTEISVKKIVADWVSDALPENSSLRDFIIPLTASFIKPNVVKDNLKTSELRESARLSVVPVVKKIEKGEYILKKDFVISSEALIRLQALQKHTIKIGTVEIIGRILFTSLLVFLFILITIIILPDDHRKKQFVAISIYSMIVFEILMNFLVRLMYANNFTDYTFLIPILFFTMMITIIMKKHMGYIITAYIAISSMLLPDYTITTFIYLICIGSLSVIVISTARRRIEMLQACVILSGAGLLLTGLSGLITGFSLSDYYVYAIISLVNSLFSGMLVVVFLPIFEHLWNLPTTFRLMELSSMNSKVLKRMAVVARGTYSHSAAVSELAESACEAIGADYLLAKVGAYYHDIGKISQPEYFIENQTGDNKHDDLKPSLSASVIKSHVKLGIERAKEIGLPPEVIDIIAQHHGSDLISYFYVEAMNLNEKNNKIAPEDYSYNGTPPMTKEAAVVMLADSTDAACRTLKQPSAPTIEKLVWKIIMDKIERKQLVNCDISLHELEEIKKSFVYSIAGRYHTRIEYPELKEGKK